MMSRSCRTLAIDTSLSATMAASVSPMNFPPGISWSRPSFIEALWVAPQSDCACGGVMGDATAAREKGLSHHRRLLDTTCPGGWLGQWWGRGGRSGGCGPLAIHRPLSSPLLHPDSQRATIRWSWESTRGRMGHKEGADTHHDVARKA